jgi:hypothetical protein
MVDVPISFKGVSENQMDRIVSDGEANGVSQLSELRRFSPILQQNEIVIGRKQNFN